MTNKNAAEIERINEMMMELTRTLEEERIKLLEEDIATALDMVRRSKEGMLNMEAEEVARVTIEYLTDLIESYKDLMMRTCTCDCECGNYKGTYDALRGAEKNLYKVKKESLVWHSHIGYIEISYEIANDTIYLEHIRKDK